MPTGLVPVSTINPANLPYVSLVDLRPTCDKKIQDTLDDVAIVDMLTQLGPIPLTNEPKQAVRVGVEDVSTWSGRDARIVVKIGVTTFWCGLSNHKSSLGDSYE